MSDTWKKLLSMIKNFFCICCIKLSNDMWIYHRIGQLLINPMNFYIYSSCAPSKADAVDMFYKNLEEKFR